RPKDPVRLEPSSSDHPLDSTAATTAATTTTATTSTAMTERRIPFTLLRTPSWDPFRDWHQGHSRIFDQAFGMPIHAEEMPAFPPTTHWPGYLRPAFMAPHDVSSMMAAQAMMPHAAPAAAAMPHMAMAPMVLPGAVLAQQQAHALSRQMSTGMSEIKQTADSWKVCLDESTRRERMSMALSPESFTRKYTLPSSANVEKVASSLSPEGMLTVEAPLAVQAIQGAEVTIPVSSEVVKK
ncbi:hypothetical protein CRUP_017461, partial [Coryphaenoides rupestris]